MIYGAAGTTQTTIDLSALTPAQGFRIDGAAAGDDSGISVAGAGDVNGDGIDDVIVGAPVADNNARSSSGSSYVIYGAAGTTQTTIDLNTLTPAQGFRIDGAAANDQSGISVAGAGDVNGDGIDDVIVGAPLADNNGRSILRLLLRDLRHRGDDADDDRPGHADRRPRASGSTAPPQTTRAAPRSPAPATSTATARRRDRRRQRRRQQRPHNSGSSYVVYGTAATTQTTIDLSTLTPAQGFRIDGAAAGDQSGYSVAGAGDVNGDGSDDVIVGAFAADNNGRTAPAPPT